MAAVDGALSLVLNERYWRNEGYPIVDTVWLLQTMFDDYLASQGDCPVELEVQTLKAQHFETAGTAGGATTTGAFNRVPFTGLLNPDGLSASFNGSTDILSIPAGRWHIEAWHTLFQSAGAGQGELRLSVHYGITTLTITSDNIRFASGTSITPRISYDFDIPSSATVWLDYRVSQAHSTQGLGSPVNWDGEPEYYGAIECSRTVLVTP